MFAGKLENDPLRGAGFALLKVDLSSTEGEAVKRRLIRERSFSVSIQEVSSEEYLQKSESFSPYDLNEVFFKVNEFSFDREGLVLSIPPAITSNLTKNFFNFKVKAGNVVVSIGEVGADGLILALESFRGKDLSYVEPAEDILEEPEEDPVEDYPEDSPEDYNQDPEDEPEPDFEAEEPLEEELSLEGDHLQGEEEEFEGPVEDYNPEPPDEAKEEEPLDIFTGIPEELSDKRGARKWAPYFIPLLILLIPLLYLLLAFWGSYWPFVQKPTVAENIPNRIPPPVDEIIRDEEYFRSGCWSAAGGLMGGEQKPEHSVDYTYCFTSPYEARVTISALDANGKILDVCTTTAVFQMAEKRLAIHEHPDGPVCQNSPDTSYYSSILACDLSSGGAADCSITSQDAKLKISAVFRRLS
jgi:hypothetical protein